jgi:hypothetical protein
MEMALQRVNLLSARRLNIQDQMIGQGEGGCRRGNGHHKLSSDVIAYLLRRQRPKSRADPHPCGLMYIKADGGYLRVGFVSRAANVCLWHKADQRPDCGDVRS